MSVERFRDLWNAYSENDKKKFYFRNVRNAGQKRSFSLKHDVERKAIKIPSSWNDVGNYEYVKNIIKLDSQSP